MCCWTRIIASNFFLVKGFLPLSLNLLKFIYYLHYICNISLYVFDLSVLFYNAYDYLQPRNEMRLSILLFSLLILSACVTTPEVVPSQEQTSTNKILTNKSDAQEARDEYKALQEQRTAQ
jgi:hypothetical protein